MHIISKIKNLLVSLVLVSVVACSSLPQQNGLSTSASNQPQKPLPSPWQQAYNESLANSVNTLPNISSSTNNTSTSSIDIWQRIRNGFQLSDGQPLHPDSQKQLNWLLKNPGYLERTSKRAEPYLYYIVGEVEKRHMPMEIALLPIVESAYRPYATSHVGAAGLWQFMPATGKLYGLKQNWWYDGRRDVIQSTKAALDYLQALHNDLGDWQLALAAYNCGEGLVMRQMKRNKAAGKPTDFWSLKLPKETSAYVPKLMAISYLVKYSSRYAIQLHPIENQPSIAVVNVGSQIELAKAANMANISKKEIYQLNPGYTRWATPPNGSQNLVLPVQKAASFRYKLQQMPVSHRVAWIRHTVSSGESLSKISHQYHTPTSVIKKANNLSSNNIRVGSHLLIPRNAGAGSLAAIDLGLQIPVKHYSKKYHYTVKSGDSLWRIAKKYKVQVAQIKAWNRSARSGHLKPGQKLVIIGTHNHHIYQAKTKHYTIKRGDSLWTISQQFNVTVAKVRQWNQLPKNKTLHPGQRLQIHLD